MAAAAGLLALHFAHAPAFAQAGSTGGTLGKSNKSVSGGAEEVEQEPRAKSHAAKHAEPSPRSESRATGSADGTWAVSAAAACVPPWTLTISVNNGVITGSGASGQVSRGGAIKGNAVVLGFKFDFIGHFRGREASGTFVGFNGCNGQWTGTKA
jgi:hypothetical protein